MLRELINIRLAAVRRLAYEAADAGLLSPELAAGISSRQRGPQTGALVWVTGLQRERLRHASGRPTAELLLENGTRTNSGHPARLRAPAPRTCGTCLGKLAASRGSAWAIVDLVGKGRHIRTVPVPEWVKETLDTWLTAAGIESGPLFRCVCRAGKLWGKGISEKTVWHVVKKTATSMNIPRLAPHDLRRSCARFCHDSGGEQADPVPSRARLGTNNGSATSVASSA